MLAERRDQAAARAITLDLELGGANVAEKHADGALVRKAAAVLAEDAGHVHHLSTGELPLDCIRCEQLLAFRDGDALKRRDKNALDRRHPKTGI